MYRFNRIVVIDFDEVMELGRYDNRASFYALVSAVDLGRGCKHSMWVSLSKYYTHMVTMMVKLATSLL